MIIAVVSEESLLSKQCVSLSQVVGFLFFFSRLGLLLYFLNIFPLYIFWDRLQLTLWYGPDPLEKAVVWSGKDKELYLLFNGWRSHGQSNLIS